MRSVASSGIPSALKRILRPWRQLVEVDCSSMGSCNWGMDSLLLVLGKQDGKVYEHLKHLREPSSSLP